MQEDPLFIRRDISHYEAMLKLRMADENRATLMRLLVEAERELAAATGRGEGQTSSAATCQWADLRGASGPRLDVAAEQSGKK
jgi:hypothetical protein